MYKNYINNISQSEIKCKKYICRVDNLQLKTPVPLKKHNERNMNVKKGKIGSKRTFSQKKNVSEIVLPL